MAMATVDYDLAPWMRNATKYLGQKEIRGSRHNPVIVAFFAKAGHPNIKNDEVAWCSAFTNAVFYESGIRGTRSLMAKSWLKWSEGERVKTPRFGDIVVFDRGNDPAFGHVAFYLGEDDDYVYVLGGNQSDAVTKSKYKKSRLKAYIRPKRAGDVRVPKMTDRPEPKITSTEIGIGTGGVILAANPLANKDFIIGAVTVLVFAAILVTIIRQRLAAT